MKLHNVSSYPLQLFFYFFGAGGGLGGGWGVVLGEVPLFTQLVLEICLFSTYSSYCHCFHLMS